MVLAGAREESIDPAASSLLPRCEFRKQAGFAASWRAADRDQKTGRGRSGFWRAIYGALNVGPVGMVLRAWMAFSGEVHCRSRIAKRTVSLLFAVEPRQARCGNVELRSQAGPTCAWSHANRQF